MYFDSFVTIDKVSCPTRGSEKIGGLPIESVWIEMSDIGSGDEGISSQSTYFFKAVQRSSRDAFCFAPF